MTDWDNAMTRRLLVIVAMTAAALTTSPAAAQPQLTVQGPGGTPLGGLLEFGGRDAWVAQMDGNRVHIFEVASGRLLRTLDIPNTARPGQLPLIGFAAHPTDDVVFLCSPGDGTTTAVDVKTGTERWRARIAVAVSSMAGAALHLNVNSDALTIFRSDYAAGSRDKNDMPMSPVTVARLRASTGESIGTVDRIERPSIITIADPQWYVGFRQWKAPPRRGPKVEYLIYEVGTNRQIGPSQTRMLFVNSGSRRAVSFEDGSVDFELIEAESGERLGAWQGGPGLFSADGSRLWPPIPSLSDAGTRRAGEEERGPRMARHRRCLQGEPSRKLRAVHREAESGC